MYPALDVNGLFQVISTNELGQSSTTKRNVLGQVRKQEKATALYSNLVTTRNYDLQGRMTSLVDPAGNTWTYTFDSLGRNISKVDPDAGTWSYGYDDAGRVVSQVDAKAQTTTLEYDVAGRPQYKRVRPTGGATGTVTETVETVYGTSAAAFNKGRVTTLLRRQGTSGAELNGKLAFEYDALGRVKKQTRTIDGTNYAVERNFDTAGYLRGMKYPDNDTIGQFGGTGTALGYDTAGRLTSIPGILASVTYNALGAPLLQTNTNGTTTTKAYDAERFWLTDIDTATPSLTLQNLQYTMNDAGMATAVNSDVVNEDFTYGYDELNRLTSSTNGVPANNHTWTYDNVGRITYNSRVGSYQYNVGSGIKPAHGVKTINVFGAENFYDANGNMTSGNGRTMTWSPENMITQVTANSTTTTFTYGPDGDRIKKTHVSSLGTKVTLYPFGDDYEVDGNNGQVTKYFDAGFGVIAKKVTLTGGFVSNKYWLHTDRLGSINATTDEGGAWVLRRSYRSYGELFGETRPTGGAHTESLGYIGQRTDGETANGTADDKGLTYLHARYYDAALGIFLSPDPIGADSNTYRYSFGDSVNFSDPSGLVPCRNGWENTASFAGGPTQNLGSQSQVRCGPTAAEQASFAFFGYCLATGCLFDDVLEEIERVVRTPRDRGSDNRDKDCSNPKTPCTAPKDPNKPEDKKDEGKKEEVTKDEAKKDCSTSAHGLVTSPSAYAYHERTNGNRGALSPTKYEAGGAAVIPSQFGLPDRGSAIRPYAPRISARIDIPMGRVLFTQVSDVIGGASARASLQRDYPGRFIFELPPGQPNLENVNLIVSVPQALPCPVGSR